MKRGSEIKTRRVESEISTTLSIRLEGKILKYVGPNGKLLNSLGMPIKQVNS